MGGIGSGTNPGINPDAFHELCARIPDATSIGDVLKDLGLNWSALARARARDPEIDLRYRIACEARAERIADEGLKDLDVKQLQDLNPKIASAAANLAGHRSKQRQWLASRYAPDRFGERITHAGSVNHRLVVELPPLLNPANPAAATASLAPGEAGGEGMGAGMGRLGPGPAPEVDYVVETQEVSAPADDAGDASPADRASDVGANSLPSAELARKRGGGRGGK